MLTARLEAQASSLGQWSTGFDHVLDHTTGWATDYLLPFRDSNGPGGFRNNHHRPGEPGQPDGWGWTPGIPTNPFPGWFNAIHLSLIPKGVHRGRVVVWNRYPVLLRPGDGLDGTNYWSFQSWAIVDPNPVAPRFRNFLLPIEAVSSTPPVLTTVRRDIFCAAHCFSPAGDLVIVGATDFLLNPNPPPLYLDLGLKYAYLFDPGRANNRFPGTSSPFYPDFGWFERRPFPDDLVVHRYYPTATQLPVLNRYPLQDRTESVGVTGGSHLPSAQTQVGLGDPRNTWENMLVRGSATSTFLQRDPLLRPAGSFQPPPFEGPGLGTPASGTWLDEYPRIHAVSDGSLFRSGYSPAGAKVNPESPPTAPGLWNTLVGPPAPTWPNYRKEGASVFFARLGTFQDMVVRLCGHGGGNSTDTAEYCLVTASPTSPWKSLGTVPGGGREHINAVILPDASILVIGGNNAVGPVNTTAQYRQGAGWKTLAPTPTPRVYHSTAVLLPDARVMVAGGEELHAGGPLAHDYDIFEPPYLHTGQTRPSINDLDSIPRDSEGTYLLSNDQQDIHCICEVEGPAYLDKLVLIAPGSTTHHSDMAARYIELESTAVSERERAFKVPGVWVAQRGYYMLFALTNGGVPSEAAWVRIE